MLLLNLIASENKKKLRLIKCCLIEIKLLYKRYSFVEIPFS